MGQPFTAVSAALDRAYQRVEAFNADPERMARHALKVMLMFTLLERRQLPLDGLSGYLDGIPLPGVQPELPWACPFGAGRNVGE
jgi:hypothetical protein